MSQVTNSTGPEDLSLARRIESEVAHDDPWAGCFIGDRKTQRRVREGILRVGPLLGLAESASQAEYAGSIPVVHPEGSIR